MMNSGWKLISQRTPGDGTLVFSLSNNFKEAILEGRPSRHGFDIYRFNPKKGTMDLFVAVETEGDEINVFSRIINICIEQLEKEASR